MDREKVMNGLQAIAENKACQNCCYPYMGHGVICGQEIARDAVVLLKEQESLLGIQQTADSITFISTGTAQQGEARGLLLGKMAMHEWLEKELLYRGLLTDDIRAVFDEAKRQ